MGPNAFVISTKSVAGRNHLELRRRNRNDASLGGFQWTSVDSSGIVTGTPNVEKTGLLRCCWTAPLDTADSVGKIRHRVDFCLAVRHSHARRSCGRPLSPMVSA